MARRPLLAAALALAACTTTGSQGPGPEQPPQPARPPPKPSVDLEAMDRPANPCADFYQYACGGWLAKTEIPADRPSWSRGFSEIQQRNQSVLRQILQDAAAGKGGADATTKKLGDFYESCMAEERIEKATAGEL